jgi:hypothetical protein
MKKILEELLQEDSRSNFFYFRELLVLTGDWWHFVVKWLIFLPVWSLSKVFFVTSRLENQVVGKTNLQHYILWHLE